MSKKKRIIFPSLLKIALSKKPPCTQVISELEAWLLNEKTKERIRRICGASSVKNAPTFVPAELENPFNVKNPQKEYICLNAAGLKTDHEGIGFCYLHDKRQRKKLAKNIFLDIKKENGGKDKLSPFPKETEELILQLGDFDFYLQEAKAQSTPDELLDLTRPLYELEALKLMTIAWMKKFGFSPDAIESIAKRIQESADVQLTLAKRDHEIIRNKAIATILRSMITGILLILDKTIPNNPKLAKEIASKVNDELLLPLNTLGITELLKRQEAMGSYNKAMAILQPDEIQETEYEDLKDE